MVSSRCLIFYDYTCVHVVAVDDHNEDDDHFWWCFLILVSIYQYSCCQNCHILLTDSL